MGIINKLSKTKEESKKKVVENTKVVKIQKEIKNKNSKIHKVLLKPVVSEKATDLEINGKYVFIVSKTANKLEVKRAVKDLYGVLPISVSIINVEGKKKRFGATIGRKSDYKKAIISLAKGKTIHIHEGV